MTLGLLIQITLHPLLQLGPCMFTTKRGIFGLINLELISPEELN